MFVPLPDTPGRAREIAEAVDRDDDRLLEGRHVKGGGQMREMMLDLVERRRESAGPESLAPADSGISSRAATVLEPVEHQPQIRAMRRRDSRSSARDWPGCPD